jgi:hypothetical protein
LYLSNNSLKCLEGIDQFSNLTSLSASNNEIRYLNSLAPLSRLPSLTKLSLDGNVVTKMPFYRQYLLGLCAGLTWVDSVAVSPQERDHDKATSRRAGLQMETLRTNELRLVVLKHIEKLMYCHAQLVSVLVGKLRYNTV